MKFANKTKLTKMLALAFVTLWVMGAPAAPWPLYSIPFQQLASERLQSDEVKLAVYILRDIEWHQNEYSHPDAPYLPRLIHDAVTGLEQLDHVVAQAALGDKTSLRILLTLLESSSPRRDLTGAARNRLAGGSMVVGNFNRSVSDLGRIAVAGALERSQRHIGNLLKILAESTLAEPENVALTESATALLAQPRLARHFAEHSTLMKNFFLLMSIHPFPKVRMSGLFGLAAFARSDVFVRNHLLTESRLSFRTRLEKKRHAEILKVVAHLGSWTGTWSSIFDTIYSRWLRDPFENHLQDIGDYNEERMAQAAAGQALLMAAGTLSRELTVKRGPEKVEVSEILQFNESLVDLAGLQSSYGNGTGFSLAKILRGHSDDPPDVTIQTALSPFGITLRAGSENSWILRGMTHAQLTALAYADELSPVEIFYGHVQSVVSWLKFKLLRLERRPSQADQEVGSIFSAPLETLFAARALALFEETQLATEILTQLLPQQWSTVASKQGLVPERSEVSHWLARDWTAELTDSSKSDLLLNLFVSFDFVMPRPQARRLFTRWLSSLKDVHLIAVAQSALERYTGCESLLIDRP